MASKQTLVQRIALDGGKDIKKELLELGAVGEAAFKKLKESADNVSKAGTGLNLFFTNLRRDIETVKNGAKQIREGFNTISTAARDVARNIALVSAAVTGAAVALFALTKSSSEFVDDQKKAAQSTGLQIKEYGRLQFAFEQGNVTAEDFGVGMKGLNKAITEAAKGSGPAVAVFKKFGVAVLDSGGNVRPTEAILVDLANAFAKVPDSAGKSADAVTLFGKAGAKMIPVLDDGGAALKSLGDDAERVGRVFTDAQAKVGDAFTDALNRMTSAVGGIKNQVGLLLAPAFTKAFDAITKLITDNKDAIVSLGSAIVAQVIPVITDLVAILEGRDTDVVNKNFIAIRDTIVGLANAAQTLGAVLSTVFTIIVNAIQPVVDVVNFLIDQFNLLFGTKFQHVNAATVVLTVVLAQLLGVFRLVGAAVEGGAAIFAGLETAFGATTAAVAGFIAQGLILGGLLKTLVDDVLQTFADAVSGLAQPFKDLAATIVSSFKDMVDKTLGFFKQIIDGAKSVIDAVSSALGGGNGANNGNSPPAFAGGGQIHGRGTGKSDSILARVSNGEFIMRVEAVRKWGVDFMRSLNAGQMPAFASGGLVRSALPSFAAGGLAATGGGGGRPLTLKIGDDIFEGLIAPDTVAGQLVRYASTRNVRRAGKTPSWKV